jgi:Right handed beta helix region
MRTLARVVPLLVLAALALPSAASAQATRTWVSGVGDDANPCSRTAPCKTFAGAISKTAAKGEINCLDPGGFGGVTITKALTIKCHYTEGGVLVSGTNAIVVNAGTGDAVTLRGLDINGIGTGLNGIRVLQAKSVKVLDTEVYGFVRNALDVEPNTGTTAKVVADRNHFHDNTGVGVMVAPVGTGIARVHLRHNLIDENGCGIAGSQFQASGAFNFASLCGTNAASANTATVAINAFDNDIADALNQSVFSSGANSTVRISRNNISGSLGPALQAVNGGSLLTFNNNTVTGNPGGNGATTGSAGAFAKRNVKRTKHTW